MPWQPGQPACTSQRKSVAHARRLPRRGGFTLIEMMVVLLIIALLALMLSPTVATGRIREKTDEAVNLAEKLLPAIEHYYAQYGVFPEDNAEANLPEPEQLIGNFVTDITVEDGVLHIRLGNKMPESFHGQTISLRPLYVEGSPQTPLSWACGHASVPAGMTVAGENHTNIERILLPQRCRL